MEVFLATVVCPKNFFFCDGECKSATEVAVCDGHKDCNDGTDEMYCNLNAKVYRPNPITHSQTYTPPSADVVTTTVIPTIIGCILLVIAMLVGIQKCKQWELDRIMEMRRTRRVVQRITQRLREKNMKTLEQMRALRKRRAALAAAARADAEQSCGVVDVVNEQSHETGESSQSASSSDPLVVATTTAAPPPAYYTAWNSTGTSPPPPYEDVDALLDHYYFELFCRTDEPAANGFLGRRTSTSNASLRSSSSTNSHSSLASARLGHTQSARGQLESSNHRRASRSTTTGVINALSPRDAPIQEHLARSHSTQTLRGRKMFHGRQHVGNTNDTGATGGPRNNSLTTNSGGTDSRGALVAIAESADMGLGHSRAGGSADNTTRSMASTAEVKVLSRKKALDDGKGSILSL